MSETKWTPGPWVPVLNAIAGSWQVGVVRAHSARPLTSKEDAQFAAAAPDLYQAVLGLVLDARCAEQRTAGAPRKGCACSACAAAKAGRDALARARGEG